MKVMRNMVQFGLLAVLLLVLPETVRAQFTFITNTDNTITVTGYSGTNADVVIPDSTNGYPVTSIGFGAFYYRSDVTHVTIPNSVTNIRGQAFCYCGLTSVTIPIGIKNIEDATFYYCQHLTNVVIPDGVTNIGDSAFSAAPLTSLTLPDSVISIGFSSFEACLTLTNVLIPKNVIQMAGDSFYDCSSLMAINVDALNPAYASLDGVLFDKAFDVLIECPGAKEGDYIIPNGVASIGDYAFAVCRNLTSIKIPDGVTNIGYWAFSQCDGIGRLDIPSSVVSIVDFAFQDCTGLRYVFFHGNASGIGARIFVGDQLSFYYLLGTTGWEQYLASLYVSGVYGYLWNPEFQTKDFLWEMQTNRFGFDISGSSGLTVVVEASTNLFNPNWQPVQTNTLTTGSAYFSDPQWTNYPGRFYRLRSP